MILEGERVEPEFELAIRHRCRLLLVDLDDVGAPGAPGEPSDEHPDEPQVRCRNRETGEREPRDGDRRGTDLLGVQVPGGECLRSRNASGEPAVSGCPGHVVDGGWAVVAGREKSREAADELQENEQAQKQPEADEPRRFVDAIRGEPAIRARTQALGKERGDDLRSEQQKNGEKEKEREQPPDRRSSASVHGATRSLPGGNPPGRRARQCGHRLRSIPKGSEFDFIPGARVCQSDPAAGLPFQGAGRWIYH